MKIAIATAFVAFAGLGASQVNPSSTRVEAPGTGYRVVPVTPDEAIPHAIGNAPVQLSRARAASAAEGGTRLDRLDDRVSDLRARAELNTVRAELEGDLEKLKVLRSNVTTALSGLRDPFLGIQAAETAVTNALNELEIAIDAVAAKVMQLEGRAPRNT